MRWMVLGWMVSAALVEGCDRRTRVPGPDDPEMPASADLLGERGLYGIHGGTTRTEALGRLHDAKRRSSFRFLETTADGLHISEEMHGAFDRIDWVFAGERLLYITVTAKSERSEDFEQYGLTRGPQLSSYEVAAAERPDIILRWRTATRIYETEAQAIARLRADPSSPLPLCNAQTPEGKALRLALAVRQEPKLAPLYGLATAWDDASTLERVALLAAAGKAFSASLPDCVQWDGLHADFGPRARALVGELEAWAPEAERKGLWASYAVAQDALRRFKPYGPFDRGGKTSIEEAAQKLLAALMPPVSFTGLHKNDQSVHRMRSDSPFGELDLQPKPDAPGLRYPPVQLVISPTIESFTEFYSAELGTVVQTTKVAIDDTAAMAAWSQRTADIRDRQAGDRARRAQRAQEIAAELAKLEASIKQDTVTAQAREYVTTSAQRTITWDDASTSIVPVETRSWRSTIAARVAMDNLAAAERRKAELIEELRRLTLERPEELLPPRPDKQFKEVKTTQSYTIGTQRWQGSARASATITGSGPKPEVIPLFTRLDWTCYRTGPNPPPGVQPEDTWQSREQVVAFATERMGWQARDAIHARLRDMARKALPLAMADAKARGASDAEVAREQALIEYFLELTPAERPFWAAKISLSEWPDAFVNKSSFGTSASLKME